MLIKSWRPISLINVDIKIASKVLAFRLRKVIHKVIHCDQTAYVKGRYIGEYVRLIDDLLAYAESENQDGILFAAGIEKAFNLVERNIIFASLKMFGFGKDFIRWVKTFLNDSQSCAMNNGTSTGYFKLERGMRQGDQLSPYLFIALETLFIQVKNDSAIRGFHARSVGIKSSAYADDTTFFVKDSHSLHRILKLMGKSHEFSSLKFSVDKCEACWIGGVKTSQSKPVRCKWILLIKKCIKILGINFSYNKTLANKENYYDLAIDCRALLNIRKQHWLSLAGKIQIFKSLVASKPVYAASVVSISDSFVQEMKSLHKEFIWSNRKPKIKHTALIGDYAESGLKDIDIESKLLSINISWVRQLKDSNFHPWKELATHFLLPLGGTLIFIQILSLAPNLKAKCESLPAFYGEVIKLWEKFSVCSKLTAEQILSEQLWNNKFILSNSKSIDYPALNTKGLAIVRDLFSEDRSVRTW